MQKFTSKEVDYFIVSKKILHQSKIFKKIKYDWRDMNYIIKLEVRGDMGREEALERLSKMPNSAIASPVSVSTVKDGIRIKEDTFYFWHQQEAIGSKRKQ